MGSWGSSAWDNDGAADWFGELFDEIGLADRVEQTLQLDVDEYHQEVRAAANLLVAIGRVYIWPIDSLERHLELAIGQLEKIKALEIYEDLPEYHAAID